MKQVVVSFAAAVLLGVSFAPKAMADEVWSLPSGNQIVYERDAGETAVLSYRAEQGLSPGLIFVVGLGGQYEERGAYQAYWTEADDAGPACPAKLVDAEGKTWKRWGVAEVRFEKKDFPSAIRVRRGECFAALGAPVLAKPVVGAGVR